MSKAILVLDEMPKDCVRCIFSGWSIEREKWVCWVTDSYGMQVDIYDYEEQMKSPERSSKPEWCPLCEIKDAPDIVTGDDFGFAEGYTNGWRDCLNEIGVNYET